MEDNFATRLKLFMDSQEVPSSQFADLCEIPRPSFSQLLSGRNQKVSDILIKKIHAAFPDLSIMWLMFGEGSMLVSHESEREENVNNTSDNTEMQECDTDKSGYSNLKALNAAEEAGNNSLYQQLEENKRLLELQMQIENLQKNPRRVTQITVYYDDSTFETFVPSK